MSGRGRGRGGRGGLSRSFTREWSTPAAEETKITQPPPLFPPLGRQPVPLEPLEDIEYLLHLRQDIIDHMQLSTAHLKRQEQNLDKSEKELDKLIAQLPTSDNFSCEWLPSELRPKIKAKRFKIRKEVDVNSQLNLLEKLEKEETTDVTIKEEIEDEEVEEEEVEVDEEMDEGTDYVNNYFDNGEGFDDEDDNLDDGAVYS